MYKKTILFSSSGSVYLATFFQNLLAGAIFGIWVGFPLVCTLTGCGATFCYLLSKAFGKVLLLQYFPNRVQVLQSKVSGLMTLVFLNRLSATIIVAVHPWGYS